MFPYLRMRKDFLADYERLQDNRELMRLTINDMMRHRRDRNGEPFEVTEGDYESWKPTMDRFRDLMIDLGDDVGIAFEYMMDFRDGNIDGDNNSLSGYNKRIDVLVGGRTIDGSYALAVVEMKQYSAFREHDDGTIYFYSNHREDNPSKQVSEYCKQLKETNSMISNGTIKLIPFVWLFNMDFSDANENVRHQLHDEYYYESEGDIRVFYKNEENELKAEFEGIFGKSNDVFSVLRKGFNRVILHESINDILSGEVSLDLKSDQRYCYNEIIDRLRNNETGVICVEGGPGSGKSAVAVMLLKYCLDNNRGVKYLNPEGAPNNAYRKDTENSFDDSFCLANRYRWHDEELIIVDEGHNLFRETYDRLIECSHNSLVVIFYDDDQNTEDQSADLAVPTNYNLNSQFRCNQDGGFLSFISAIFNNEESIFTADMLDFDFRVIRDTDTLECFVNDRDFIILAGPKFAQGNMVVEKDALRIEQWNIDYNGVFLSERYETGTNCYSGCKSVRGLEEKRVVVIIGDDEEGSDIHFDGTRIVGDQRILNTYRVLLTRGLDSCYVFCENEALRDYLHHEKRVKYV